MGSTGPDPQVAADWWSDVVLYLLVIALVGGVGGDLFAHGVAYLGHVFDHAVTAVSVILGRAHATP